MERYSVINSKNPREILLLRGSGCKWRRCKFCDYHLDFSRDDEANFKLNKAELEKVTGEYGVLEIINSGSFCDLDDMTQNAILETCMEKNISRLHVETHWRDRNTLPEIRERFADAGIRLVVKTGAETFDICFREKIMDKGMDYALPEDIAAWADEVCLLFGITGQTKESMKSDVEIGLKYFDRVCINIMNSNSTKVAPDKQVINWFMKYIYPMYVDDVRVDILIDNTDFGVGGK